MRTLLSLLTALLVAAPLLVAHHSFAATYDVNKPVTFSGAVTKVEFRNPHIWVFLDVKDGDKVTNWGCEGGAPIQLFRQGWRPDTLKHGDEISIEGFAARDGKPVLQHARRENRRRPPRVRRRQRRRARRRPAAPRPEEATCADHASSLVCGLGRGRRRVAGALRLLR